MVGGLQFCEKQFFEKFSTLISQLEKYSYNHLFRLMSYPLDHNNNTRSTVTKISRSSGKHVNM